MDGCKCIVCQGTYVKFRARVVFVAAHADLDYGLIARNVGGTRHDMLFKVRDFVIIFFVAELIKEALKRIHAIDNRPIRVKTPPIWTHLVFRTLQACPVVTLGPMAFDSVLFDATNGIHQQNAGGL